MVSTIETKPAGVSPMSVMASPVPAAQPVVQTVPPTDTAQSTSPSGASPGEAVQPATTNAAATQDPERGATFFQQLKEADRTWAWKVALRLAQCVFCLIGFGSAAWILWGAIRLPWNFVTYSESQNVDKATAVIAFIIIIFSLLYGLVELLVRAFRKPHRPVHPAVTLAMDLCFWLAFIIPVVATFFGYMAALRWGSGYYSSYEFQVREGMDQGYDGAYYLNSTTDTWIFNITRVNGGVDKWNRTTGRYDYTAPSRNNIVRNCAHFNSCEEQDAAINAIWKQNPTRTAVNLVVFITSCALLILHFVLFVWACVDTHLRRKGRQQNAIAQTIQGMVATGQITYNHGGPVPVAPPFAPVMQQVSPGPPPSTQGVRYA